MNVTVHTKGVIVTSKQKALIEKKVLQLKKYVKAFSPVDVIVTLTDESGPEKGGIDQSVSIKAALPKEEIFIKEIDDRLMRAFGFAFKSFERRLRRYGRIRREKEDREGNRIKGIINAVGSVGRLVPRRRKK
ncbi:MAG: HPF/RaiA family ribosome-associated protein [Patescibacteria group bacterium]